MHRENLLSNALEMGSYRLSRLNELAIKYPGYITNPRGLGLFCAFDLPSGIERDKLFVKAMERKMIILGSGDKSIRFRPHLNVSKNDLDTALDILFECIKAMMN